MKSILFVLLLLFGQIAIAQKELVITETQNFFGTSVSDKLQIYEVAQEMSFEDFLKDQKRFTPRKMENRLENLDFTTSTFFVEFSIKNETSNAQELVLETARPITNLVSLFLFVDSSIVYSGDAVPYDQKDIKTSVSALPLVVPANSQLKYILRIASDGENVTLPMTFWNKSDFEYRIVSKRMISGLYFGIFLFALFIYMTFYILLRERLFLIYVGYVFFSGFLQFSLHGYLHEYLATSGGYWTQHSILSIAGLTIIFALLYAKNYLEFEGKKKAMSHGLIGLSILLTLTSLIPGKTYEIAYPLINGLSFVALIFVLIAAIIQRKSKNVSKLFIIGLGALVIGGAIFILGNFGLIDNPGLTQRSLTVGTLIELLCLSILMVRRFKTLQEEKERAQKLLVNELEESNVRLESEVADRTKEIEKQRILLKEKNDDFVASVMYAKRIQNAVLSNEKKFKSILPDSFVMFRPKDIVSGDFYWVETIPSTKIWPQGLTVYATADCTGHGVPGALVSIIGNNMLKLGKLDEKVQNPGQMLDFLNLEINEILNSEFVDENIRDGMDITLCAIDIATNELHFSGAQNSAYIVRSGELIELKGDRKSIGFIDGDEVHKFSNQVFDLKTGDVIYTCSDGYADQFGGPKDKKFMSKRLKRLLVEIAPLSLVEQKERVESEFDEWRGNTEQLDDVLLIGLRIT